MKKIKLYILILAIFPAFVACEDEFLTQENPNSITMENFWKTESDFEKGLAATYGAMQFNAVCGGDNSVNFTFGDEADTETWYSSHYQNKTLEFSDVGKYNETRWDELYIGVFRANQVLQKIENVGIDVMSVETKVSIQAQTRFLRAMYYFWLNNTYGGAVIHTRVAVDQADFSKKFSDQKVVEDSIVMPDLLFAYNNLPKSWSGTDLGRVTWGAAASMLGKVNLYNEEWAEAADYFKEVIDEGIYALVANPMDNYSDQNEYNEESILEVNFSNALKPGVSSDRVDNTYNGPGTESTNLSHLIGPIIGYGGYNIFLPSYYIHELFLNDEMDPNNSVNASAGLGYSLRRHSSIVTRTDSGQFYMAPIVPNVAPWFAFGQTAYVKKYSNWYQWTREDATLGRSGINWREIRYADVLLMYAEAILERDGDASVSDAVTYIDMVRARAGVVTLQEYMTTGGNTIPEFHKTTLTGASRTYATVNSQSLLTHLQRVERPLELCFEGHRKNDLRRWGLAKQVFDDCRATEVWLFNEYNSDLQADDNIVVTELFLQTKVRINYERSSAVYTPDDHDYMPIPAKEITSNPNLYN